MTEQTQRPKAFHELLTEHIITHTGTSPLWAKTCSLVALSPFISNIYYETWKGRISPHLFALMVGPSGLASKTLPLQEIIRPIFRQVDEIIFPAEQESKNEDSYKPTESFIVPYSPQSSMQALTTYFAKNKLGLLAIDEYTSILKVAKKDGYLGEILEYISRIYDGDVGKNTTQARGEESAFNLVISMLTTTTPYIFEVMKPGFFIQGTGNRYLIVNWDASGVDSIYVPEEYIPERAGFDERKSETNKRFAQQIAAFYKFLQSKDSVILQLPPNATKQIRAKVVEIKNKALQMYKKYKLGLDYSYMDRLEIQFNKLVLNIAGSRLFGGFINGDFTENIEEPFDLHLVVHEDIGIVQEASDLVDLYFKNFESMIFDWESTAVTKDTTIHSIKGISDLCLKYCQDNGDKDGWVNRRAMLRDLKIELRVFAGFQNTFFEESFRFREGGGGAKSFWVRPLKDEAYQ
jgi:hypothetical protein